MVIAIIIIIIIIIIIEPKTSKTANVLNLFVSVVLICLVQYFQTIVLLKICVLYSVVLLNSFHFNLVCFNK